MKQILLAKEEVKLPLYRYNNHIVHRDSARKLADLISTQNKVEGHKISINISSLFI